MDVELRQVGGVGDRTQLLQTDMADFYTRHDVFLSQTDAREAADTANDVWLHAYHLVAV